MLDALQDEARHRALEGLSLRVEADKPQSISTGPRGLRRSGWSTPLGPCSGRLASLDSSPASQWRKTLEEEFSGYRSCVVRAVRQATIEDAQGIAEVHVRAWQVAYRGLLSDDELDGLSVDGRAERWTQLLSRSQATGFTLVAEEDGEVVGFCSVVAPARDEDLGTRACEVAVMYVAPERWRAGLGQALLDEAVTRLDDGRWDEATLWVFEDNPRARSFYTKRGIAPDGAIRRAADEGPPEVRLRRSLLSAATGCLGAT
jgi:ribosomal protein S18 acetylase RimI-like enzyme